LAYIKDNSTLPTMIRLIAFAIFCCSFAFSATASQPIESPRLDLTAPLDNVKPALPNHIRQHRMLPEDYTGQVIELIQSSEKMALDSPLFQQFGGVHYTRLENGRYSYCILTSFQSKSNLKAFVTNIIQPKAEYAKIVKYKAGKRKMDRQERKNKQV
jgi:hypothetical protein